MDIRYLVSALAICAFAGSVQARAQESLVTHKSLARRRRLPWRRRIFGDGARRAWSSASKKGRNHSSRLELPALFSAPS
jgi:hypothetical protein